MILEKNNLQTAQEWTKSYIELIASYVHPKTGNHPRSHLRTIMALDHRRLISGKKIRPTFLRSTSLLCKILSTNLGACKPIFYTIYTSHLRWDSTMRSMRHCFYHADRMQYFTILQYKLHSFSIRDDRSTRGLLAKKLKKNQKPSIRPGVCHFCSASCGRVFEKTLIELRSNIIKNLLCIC